MNEHLSSKYLLVKQIVCDEGYGPEISWQLKVNFDSLNESTFLKELAWVILSSGIKEQVIRKIFEKITFCFFNWESIQMIVDNKQQCHYNAIKIFNNERKISAIIQSAQKINDISFNELKKMIKKKPIETLQSFPYIGDVTAYHLAKNIGICIAKPDRHLVRIADTEGYDDVQEFCRDVSMVSGDSIPVVDVVFWRFANLHRDYLDVLSSVNFTNSNDVQMDDTDYGKKIIK